jgi:MYXO-CTERM domain-containing protein
MACALTQAVKSVALLIAFEAVAAAAPLTVRPVGAEAMEVTGTVVDVRSAWTADRSRIVTRATIRTSSGDVTVSQLGGTADGLTMEMKPIGAPPQAKFRLGATVAVAAHRGEDRLRRSHVVADDVRIMVEPAGFVRSGETERGNSVFWESGCVALTPDIDDVFTITPQAALGAIERAVEMWNSSTEDCSYLHISLLPSASGEVGKDGINRIKFREDIWCRPAVDDDPARCYLPQIAGLTTTVFVNDASSGRDGALVDADIEMNGVIFNGEGFILKVDGPAGGAECGSEVQPTLTHEIGHLLGLEHPCRVDEDPPRIDNEGNEVPFCTAVGPDDIRIRDATMFNFQVCDETIKSTLTDDDIAGICTIYPRGPNQPVACEVSGTAAGVGGIGGCSTGGGAGLGFGVIALGLLLRRRRP